MQKVEIQNDGIQLSIWTVYQSPSDHPGYFVARRWVCDDDPPLATEDMIRSRLYSYIEFEMTYRGLVKMQRHPCDDPCILETWI